MEFNEVAEVNVIYGEYDLIAKVNVGDIGELDSFTDRIRKLPLIY